MQGEEVGVALLHDEGAEGKTQGYVVEGVRLGRRGKDGAWDGELEGWGHGLCKIIL